MSPYGASPISKVLMPPDALNDRENGLDARTVSLVVVAVVAAGFALYFGRQLFQPITIAVVLNALFRPVVREINRARIPNALAAAVVVLALMAALVVGGYMLSGPVQQWIDSAPQSFEAAHDKIERLRRPVQKVTAIATKIEEETQPASATTNATTAPEKDGEPVKPAQPPAPAPAPQAPGIVAGFFGTTAAFITGALEVLLMLDLLLASGDLFVQKLVKMLPFRRDKEVARKVVGDIEVAVARYMYATLLINTGQAIVVAVAMKLLGVPHWILWGLATVVLEFVPYLGAAVMIGLLAVTAFTTFDNLGHILAVPGTYFVITSLQNNVVSPYAYGNRLRLNPVAVLIGVLLWWFLWGIPGAFVSVPILAAVKIFADRTENLKAVGEFLGE